ncbi:MAG TPA: acyl-CoA dehydrogenase family protein [Nocardiopsis listeri]|uniref:acyl-CoA dehydrogenase family protein n=1 Tax=Nocardiopsis listeri TaxID=53440 RepID=UPI001DE85BA5|nr:acyl-CoA dehydrogenase family protein [Nocardiopsis listeri]HJE59658.1 acyl-CoA dehydrogenase family protein [Nocardiopsis listeri]
MSHRSSEQGYEGLRSKVREFAREEVAPLAAESNRRGAFPYALVETMGGMGLFGLPFPERHGGGGGDHLSLCLAVEELARVDSSVAATLSAAVSLGASPIAMFGDSEQKERWLPELCAGRALAAFGLTEPHGGSDAGAPRTRAVEEGTEWVLDGNKSFITNSGTDITRLVTVTAVTGERADGRPEISAIIVPSATPGLTVREAYTKLGWRASDTHALSLSACRVPRGNLLGRRGRGFSQFLAVLDRSRITLAALGTGVAQGCVDEAVRHAREREAFGARLGAHQAVRFRIADMEARVHNARLSYQHAASRMMRGEPFTKEAAIAKLTASEAAMDNARDAVQVLGGQGCMDDSVVARHYRDAKILEIGEGTSEVQRMVIAHHLDLP